MLVPSISTFSLAACADTVVASDGSRFSDNDAFQAGLKASAARDLPCPLEQVQLSYVSQGRFSASGCGWWVMYRPTGGPAETRFELLERSQLGSEPK